MIGSIHLFGLCAYSRPLSIFRSGYRLGHLVTCYFFFEYQGSYVKISHDDFSRRFAGYGSWSDAGDVIRARSSIFSSPRKSMGNLVMSPLLVLKFDVISLECGIPSGQSSRGIF